MNGNCIQVLLISDSTRPTLWGWHPKILKTLHIC